MQPLDLLLLIVVIGVCAYAYLKKRKKTVSKDVINDIIPVSSGSGVNHIEVMLFGNDSEFSMINDTVNNRLEDLRNKSVNLPSSVDFYTVRSGVLVVLSWCR